MLSIQVQVQLKPCVVEMYTVYPTAGTVELRGVYLSIACRVDVQGVSINSPCSVEVQGISLSTASSVDVEGLSNNLHR
jgi:hypothetical protein